MHIIIKLSQCVLTFSNKLLFERYDERTFRFFYLNKYSNASFAMIRL